MDIGLTCPNCGYVKRRPVTVWPWTCLCGYRLQEDGSGELVASGPRMPPQKAETPPSIAAKGANYVRAWWRWRRAGEPLRPPAEVERIRAICRGCRHYRDGDCLKCGCRVSRGTVIGDKVAWATERCPVGLWG